MHTTFLGNVALLKEWFMKILLGEIIEGEEITLHRFLKNMIADAFYVFILISESRMASFMGFTQKLTTKTPYEILIFLKRMLDERKIDFEQMLIQFFYH